MLSVIIPTRNRASLLDTALSSLAGQTFDASEFEVIVVDNGSTDDTKKQVSRWMDCLRNLRYVTEAVPGLHSARHRGMDEAEGDILVFADDDIVATPTWLQAHYEAFDDPEVALVGGNAVPLFQPEPPDWIIDLWQSSLFRGSRSLPWLSLQEHPHGRRRMSPLNVWGCNFGIRRKTLLDAGGFHPDAMPKELVCFRGDGETHVARFVQRNRLVCLFDSGASVMHRVTAERMEMGYFHKRGFLQGISDSYTMIRNEQDLRLSSVERLRSFAVQSLRRLLRVQPRHPLAVKAVSTFMTGHAGGVRFHQSAYDSDAELREWVHRRHYLGPSRCPAQFVYPREGVGARV